MKAIEKEVWKPIIGFKDYKINDFGDVKSFKRRGKEILLKQTPTNQFHLVSDTGDRIAFKRLRLLYSVIHGINPTEIEGYVVGTLSNMRVISKEEYFKEITQKSICGRKLDEEKMRLFYIETMRDIDAILNYHQTGDITKVAELVNRHKDAVVAYMRKRCYGNDDYINEIWASVQEECITGIYYRNYTILNICSYLIRMVRTEVAGRKRKESRTLHYDDYQFYQGI